MKTIILGGIWVAICAIGAAMVLAFWVRTSDWLVFWVLGSLIGLATWAPKRR